jgi:hypothetical protein
MDTNRHESDRPFVANATECCDIGTTGELEDTGDIESFIIRVHSCSFVVGLLFL